MPRELGSEIGFRRNLVEVGWNWFAPRKCPVKMSDTLTESRSFRKQFSILDMIMQDQK